MNMFPKEMLLYFHEAKKWIFFYIGVLPLTKNCIVVAMKVRFFTNKNYHVIEIMQNYISLMSGTR